MHHSRKPGRDEAVEIGERLALHDDLAAKLCELSVTGNIEEDSLQQLSDLSESICRALSDPSAESLAEADRGLETLEAAVHNITVNQAMDEMRSANPEEFARCLAARAGLDPQAAEQSRSCDCVYPELDASGLESALRQAAWQPYTHPKIAPGSLAFRSAIPGVSALVDISSLPPDTQIQLSAADRNGRVSAHLAGDPSSGSRESFTIVILGPNDTTGQLEMWTFYPGPTICPHTIANASLAGEKVPASRALQLGFDFATIRAAI